MKHISILLLIVLLCISLPLIAQEQEKAKQEMTPMPEPPKPLGDDWNWMVGEWEGWSESPMGKSKEWEKAEFGLDKQFLLIKGTSEMEGMTYKGIGALTVNPETEELVGYWIDNYRCVYEGKGKQEGNKSIMKWVGPMGESTRIQEKVDNNKYILTVKATGPDGKEMESKAVMIRKKSE
jgi:hypothetical protein